jgi:HAD superfamily hydrolase (TIGR01484 family)
MTTPRSLSALPLKRVRAVLSDVDGTLTTGGLLLSSTVRAIERVSESGLPVVLVTGRPAGFAEAWVRTLPVRGIVAENGGLWFARGKDGRVHKTYAFPESELVWRRQKLEHKLAEVFHRFPEARLSTDSRFTEVDLAIDHNEEVHLNVSVAQAIEKACRDEGLSAVRSSVHINCWFGDFDKFTTATRFLQEQLGLSKQVATSECVYLGDGLNDAPMFGGFKLSVGVANVRDVWDELEHKPNFVTRLREGPGAESVLQALARARVRKRSRTRLAKGGRRV